ncbi:MAG: hypothetical protein MJZ34_07935 [Paludibacteraceae bacterium]|nr:hypothetical protein [Paludibacteraceae bacterium]
MRTKRKDNFVIIFSFIWLLANVIVDSIFGIDKVWIPNTIAIVIMIIILFNNRLMKWFNERK